MRDDVKCEKCEKTMGYGYGFGRKEVRLVGGIRSVLCTPCVNLWEDYVYEEQQELYRECRRIENEIKSISNCFRGTGAESILYMKKQLTNAENALDEYVMRFRGVAREWLADTVEIDTVEA